MSYIKIFLITGVMVFHLATNLKAQQVKSSNLTLTARQQALVPISAFTAQGNMPPLREALNKGLDAGLTINEIKEVLVQLYAYAGFPRSLNALNAYLSVLQERQQKGIKDEPGQVPKPLPANKTRLQLGTEVQTQLVGQPVKGAVYEFAPAIDQFLKEHLFGDIFGRDNLDWQTREIATISALASLGGTENQLRSHFNVGLNTGLTEAQLKNLVAVLQAKVGGQEGHTAHQVLQSVLKKPTTTNPLLTKNLDEPANTNHLFPKGSVVAGDNFSGPAWLQMLVENSNTLNTSVGNVTFEPGTRTKWHYHPGGQILLVTSGRGRYQEKGKPVRELRQGDVVTCEPQITHWHGASPGEEFSHIAVGTNTHKGTVVWLAPVTDEEYNR